MADRDAEKRVIRELLSRLAQEMKERLELDADTHEIGTSEFNDTRMADDTEGIGSRALDNIENELKQQMAIRLMEQPDFKLAMFEDIRDVHKELHKMAEKLQLVVYMSQQLTESPEDVVVPGARLTQVKAFQDTVAETLMRYVLGMIMVCKFYHYATPKDGETRPNIPGMPKDAAAEGINGPDVEFERLMRSIGANTPAAEA